MAGGRLLGVHGGQHLLRAVGQLVRIGVDQEQLLLRPNGERVAVAEPVLHVRAPSAEPAAILPSTSAAASPLA